MSFPEFGPPSSRSYKPGSFAVKTFKSMNGMETRILYGDKQYGAELALTYKAIKDTDAEKFVEHFRSVNGTYDVFSFVGSGGKEQAYEGWGGDNANLSPSQSDPRGQTRWRYKEPPRITNVQSGYSDVVVTLVGEAGT